MRAMNGLARTTAGRTRAASGVVPGARTMVAADAGPTRKASRNAGNRALYMVQNLVRDLPPDPQLR